MKTIVELAKPYEWLGAEGWTFNTYAQLEAFAKLVAEAATASEREACAAIDFRKHLGVSGDDSYEISNLIRNRGNV